MDVHLTTGWSFERLGRYGRDITAAMKKLAARFPNDVTVESLARECLTGQKQLWLILEGEAFVSFVLTEIKTTEATGHRMVIITSLAGEEGVATVPLIGKIEDWAREQGAQEMSVVGRLGWKRVLADHGYRIDAALFRKPL